MARERIDIEQAEQKMFELLKKEQMGDRIYEFAQDLYQRYINVLETKYNITNKDVLDRDEEWYDNVHDEFFQGVYNRMLGFLIEGE